MIVKSQQNDVIVNFDKINFISIEKKDSYIIFIHCENGKIEIARYKTESEAKNTLERIYAAAVIGERYLNLSEKEEREE